MLLKGATLVSLDPPRVEEVDLRIEADRIAERGAALAARAGEEILGLEGRVVLPGLVNAHTHLYGALARGMPGPAKPPRGFLEILERIWWRLDGALDDETVYLSGLVGGIEAALSGTTLLFDHHASRACIRGSLKTLRRALEEVGLRSVLCYEVTDRNGADGREQGIQENVAFSSEPPTPLTRGMVGAHASFTLSDEALAALAAAIRDRSTSLHVHVAEDRVDVEDCHNRFGLGLVERFRRHGLLGPNSLLAHCVHLAPAELEQAQAGGAWIAHNPRSNMNNAVGRAPTRAFVRAALGTDGVDEDMLAEARAAYLGMKETGRNDAADAALALLAGGQRLGAAFFGLRFGVLDPGAPADLVITDYRPPTPIHSENAGTHLLFGIDRSHVRSVMVAGRLVVRDRRVTGVDADAVLARARVAAGRLWERMRD
ncbi:MAG TPA: amidohydrolase family protein [Vicinamibacteria bacterium]|nr:amidohydrolase family protein [Vicinamibacteria bacterium]